MKITAISNYSSDAGWIVAISADTIQSTSAPAHSLNDAIADAVGALIEAIVEALPTKQPTPPRFPGEMTVRERIATQSLGAVYAANPGARSEDVAGKAWEIAGELEKQFTKP